VEKTAIATIKIISKKEPPMKRDFTRTGCHRRKTQDDRQSDQFDKDETVLQHEGAQKIERLFL
jgi:hypothetical protein